MSKVVFKAFILVCAGALVSACSLRTEQTASAPTPSEQTDMDVATDLPEIDFAALFARTDEIEVCTKILEDRLDRSVGPDFYPAGYEQLGCECWSDMVSHFLDEYVGTRPALKRASLQLASNLEVMPYFINKKEHPHGMEAFLTFMDKEGAKTLGFSSDELMDVIARAATKSASVLADPAALADQVPSCSKLVDYSRQLYPGIADTDIGRVANTDRALQRLRFDNSIDMNVFDTILISDDPMPGCLLYFGEGRTAKEAAELCFKFSDKRRTIYCNASDAEFDIARRLALASGYLRSDRTTAQIGDELYYIASRAAQLGWSVDHVENIFFLLGEEDELNRLFPNDARSDFIQALRLAEI